MVLRARLLDLALILAVLSIGALSQRNPGQSSAIPGAIWSDSSLSLKLCRLPGRADLRRTRLQLSLTNRSGASCWIPGSFCQEFKEADGWSHAVRVKVAYAYRADLACPQEPPWSLGPSYGERSLHEHQSFTSLIKPQQTMKWEFCLGDLVQGTEQPVSGWEQAQGPFRVSCQLCQSDHKVVSNTLEIGP